MKSKWFVSSNPIAGYKTVWQVVRIRCTDEVDHSGNREVYEYYDTKAEAQSVAEMLNEEEENEQD